MRTTLFLTALILLSAVPLAAQAPADSAPVPPSAEDLAAGGLVFAGSNEGLFFSLDAATGRPLWHFQMGGQLNANPIAFAIGGKEYVAEAAGVTMQVFTLSAP